MVLLPSDRKRVSQPALVVSLPTWATGYRQRHPTAVIGASLASVEFKRYLCTSCSKTQVLHGGTDKCLAILPTYPEQPVISRGLRSDVHGWSVISGRTQKAVVGSLDQDTGWTAWNETEGLKAWGWHVLK